MYRVMVESGTRGFLMLGHRLEVREERVLARLWRWRFRIS